MQKVEGGLLLMQIDLTSKVCRKDGVLDHIRSLMDRGYDNDRINEEMKNSTVVTSYSKAGKHTYKIERIEFTKSPNDTFEKKDATVSFKQYFYEQYGKKVTDEN
jgi:hypothetical protein